MRNENNYLARQSNEFELPDYLLSLSSDFARDFYKIYDTKSEAISTGQISANRLKSIQPVHLQRNNMTEK